MEKVSVGFYEKEYKMHFWKKRKEKRKVYGVVWTQKYSNVALSLGIISH